MAGSPTTTFIDAQYLRDNTIINDNVDSKILMPIIIQSQYKYIQQIIGTSLYNKLITLVNAYVPALITPQVGIPGQPGYVPAVYGAPGTPIPTNYATLLYDYIIPVLTQYTIWESIPYMQFKMRNKSISKQSSENSEPASLEELNYLRSNVLSTAEFFAQRMSTYLCESASLYPEYNVCGDLNPTKQNYNNGIYTPKRYYNSNKYNRGYRY